jgi:hypothetical protein
MPLSIRGRASRAVFIALAIAGCDTKSPTELRSENGLTVPDQVSFAASTGSTVSAAAVSPTEIDLSWQGASPKQLSGFQIFRSTTGPTGSYFQIASVAATATRYPDVELTQSTSYCYEIRSYKTSGRNTTYSAYSAPACATTKISPPTATNATAQGSTTVVITWTWGPGTASGFRVERSASNTGPWQTAATTSSSARSYIDAARESEKIVCYRVVALNTGGESGPSNVDCTTPLASPTNLVAAAVSDGIQLTWQDNSSFEFKFLIQAATDGVTFYDVATVPANTTSFHQPGVSSDKQFWYRIAAQREGLSDFSNVATTTGGCVPTSDTEVCDNNLDDDCNGLVDYNDPACGELTDCNANPCGSGTICNGAYCVSSCGDGYRDSDESDIDCGGGCGNTCQLNQECWGNWDCASNNCVYSPGAFRGVCQAPPPSQP